MTLKQYAIYKMIYETCGEDPEMLEDCHILEIDADKYHLTYNEDDPYDGVDLKFKITMCREEREVNGIARHRDIAVYTITDSVYGDDGTFEIVL